MKVLKLFTLLVLISQFISCSILGESDEEKIVGTWLLSSFKTTNCDSDSYNSNYQYDDGCYTDEIGYKLCHSIEFTSSGSYTIEYQYREAYGYNDQFYEETGSYFINDDKIKFCPEDDACYKNDFEVSKGELVLVGEGSNGCDYISNYERK